MLGRVFRFLLEADTDKDGRISAEEFKAFALKHPETLVGLIHMHTILLNLLQCSSRFKFNTSRAQATTQPGPSTQSHSSNHPLMCPLP